MDKMVTSAVGIAVFFVLLSAIVIPNFQDAQDTTSDADVEILIYLVLLLFLVAIGLGVWSKHK